MPKTQVIKCGGISEMSDNCLKLQFWVHRTLQVAERHAPNHRQHAKGQCHQECTNVNSQKFVFKLHRKYISLVQFPGASEYRLPLSMPSLYWNPFYGPSYV